MPKPIFQEKEKYNQTSKKGIWDKWANMKSEEKEQEKLTCQNMPAQLKKRVNEAAKNCIQD